MLTEIKMKTLNYLLLISLSIGFLSLISCSGTSLKTIDEKIEKQGMEAKFSSGEYEAMIGFIEKLITKKPQLAPSDETQTEEFGENFGKMFTYMMVLGLAKDNGNLTSSQIAKLDKLQQSALLQTQNTEVDYQERFILDDNEEYNTYESSEGSQKVIVDLNGNIIGNYVGETSTTYKGFAQDEFEVSKSNYKVIELNNENGEGVVFCRFPGDIIKVYAQPSLNAPVIGNMIYEEGSLPLTYECIGKKLNWYKIRFNHKTGYVLDDSVEWAAEDYF